MTDLLNRSQYSALTVALSSLEQDLREAACWLRGSELSGILYQRSLQLSPEHRSAALSLIDEALAEIAQLSSTFGLLPQSEDLSRRIVATMSLDWATLLDVRSDKLRRYGDVDPALDAALGPHVERLAGLALSLSRLMDKAGTR